jgi:hypothetical protein
LVRSWAADFARECSLSERTSAWRRAIQALMPSQ